jgi:hypothetical protein
MPGVELMIPSIGLGVLSTVDLEIGSRVLINYKVEIPELQGQLHIMFLRIPTVGLVPEDLAPKCHVEPQERLRVTV